MGLHFVEVDNIQNCIAHPVEIGCCAIPLFHGTRLYALTATDKERESFCPLQEKFFRRMR